MVSDTEGDLGGELTLEPLMEDPMYVALARTHPLAGKAELTMGDLRDEIWIEGGGINSAGLHAAARRAGYEPRIAFESTSWLGKQGLVAAGIGITLMPTIALDTVHESVILRSLGDDAPLRQISIATDSGRYRAPGVEPMKAILHEVAAEHRFALEALVV